MAATVGESVGRGCLLVSGSSQPGPGESPELPFFWKNGTVFEGVELLVHQTEGPVVYNWWLVEGRALVAV